MSKQLMHALKDAVLDCNELAKSRYLEYVLNETMPLGRCDHRREGRETPFEHQDDPKWMRINIMVRLYGPQLEKAVVVDITRRGYDFDPRFGRLYMYYELLCYATAPTPQNGLVLASEKALKLQEAGMVWDPVNQCWQLPKGVPERYDTVYVDVCWPDDIERDWEQYKDKTMVFFHSESMVR